MLHVARAGRGDRGGRGRAGGPLTYDRPVAGAGGTRHVLQASRARVTVVRSGTTEGGGHGVRARLARVGGVPGDRPAWGWRQGRRARRSRPRGRWTRLVPATLRRCSRRARCWWSAGPGHPVAWRRPRSTTRPPTGGTLRDRWRPRGRVTARPCCRPDACSSSAATPAWPAPPWRAPRSTTRPRTAGRRPSTTSLPRAPGTRRPCCPRARSSSPAASARRRHSRPRRSTTRGRMRGGPRHRCRSIGSGTRPSPSRPARCWSSAA